MSLPALPVDRIIPEILASLRAVPNLVIEAPPGAGKTTRVPPALLEFGDVIVLEPRRLAARMAARRVAEEMGERLGQTFGYQVRFEEVAGPDTRLRFLTEGVLTRRLLRDPDLRGVSTVILDEFHERHLDGDVALALLRRLQRKRKDLRLVVMSATLDGASVSQYLGNCPIARSEGRLHPIDIAYTPHAAAPLEDQVAAALERLAKGTLPGHVLVFLPGAAEIRRCLRACESIANRTGSLLLPLYGDLSPEEQDRAVLPSAQTKIILSTNVAESSLTIEGVTAVIDSGLHRIATDNPYTGIPSLEVVRISKSSAVQRAGRAGRTAPGRVIRLYPLEDFVRRPDADLAEILRRELSPLVLDLHAMNIAVPDVPWFEPPPQPALDAGENLLRRLGAFARYREISRIPLHPRLATMLLEGGAEMVPLAAALSSNDRIQDLHRFEPSFPAQRLAAQLRRSAGKASVPFEIAVLKAFPDRVVRAHTVSTTLHNKGLLLALDLEQRREHKLPVVRLGMAIEPEWLIDAFPDRVTERLTVDWNRTAERVESVSALLYEDIVIEESRSGAVDPEQAAALLARKAKEAGIDRFTDPEELEAFLARVQFAGLDAPDLDHALERVCHGLRSFADLKQTNFIATLRAQLPPGKLDSLAPERITLPSGRAAKIQYSRDKSPAVASRLQDFFGMTDTPRIGPDRTPLTVHLLAPNQRPVQMTTDLAGFWTRLYPTVRRELMRRYPRHQWPEKP